MRVSRFFSKGSGTYFRGGGPLVSRQLLDSVPEAGKLPWTIANQMGMAAIQ